MNLLLLTLHIILREAFVEKMGCQVNRWKCLDRTERIQTSTFSFPSFPALSLCLRSTRHSSRTEFGLSKIASTAQIEPHFFALSPLTNYTLIGLGVVGIAVVIGARVNGTSTRSQNSVFQFSLLENLPCVAGCATLDVMAVVMGLPLHACSRPD